ncbi:MAG: hypothetical protein ACKOYN_07405 [Planctomycetota bacterium]
MISLAALAIAGSSSAAFIGYDVQNAGTVGGLTKWVLFGQFTAGSTDTVLNAFHFNKTVGGGNPVFWHNDALSGAASTVAGTWNPQFVLAPGAMDSYVCIGGGEGFASGNSTNADPDWGAAGFNQAQVPFLAAGTTTSGAGWFNGNPPNLQGRVDASGKVKLGQFVIGSNDPSATLFLKVGFNNGQGGSVVFGEGTFTIPAPGAIALLGLAGLAGRRRR